MGSAQENPTILAVSDEVRQAVLDCYCQLHHAELETVEHCFTGGIEFDSILGVELAPHVEAALQITIPDKSLMDSKVFASLATFAAMVQECIDGPAKEERT